MMGCIHLTCVYVQWQLISLSQNCAEVYKWTNQTLARARRHVAESSLDMFSQCHGKTLPGESPVPQKPSIIIPVCHCYPHPTPFHPALPHTSSQLSLSPLCFWYLSRPLSPPMLFSFSLFLKESGFSTSFCFSSIYRLKQWLEARGTVVIHASAAMFLVSFCHTAAQ